MSPTTHGHDRLIALATRLGCTEGQVYTMTIGLTVAILLAFAVPGTLGGAVPAAGQPSPPPAAAPPAGPPVESGESPTTHPSAPTNPGPAPVPPPSATSPPMSDSVTPEPTPPAPSPAPPTSGPLEPSPEEDEDVSCPMTEGLEPIMQSLGETGVVPDQSTTLLLARVAGCSETDPAVLLLGALAEFGEGLPDPGPEVPGVPLPRVRIPEEIIEAVQPFRDAIDPMCDAMGDVSTVIFYGFATWPAGIDQVLLTPVRQVLLACGQIRQPDTASDGAGPDEPDSGQDDQDTSPAGGADAGSRVNDMTPDARDRAS